MYAKYRKKAHNREQSKSQHNTQIKQNHNKIPRTITTQHPEQSQHNTQIKQNHNTQLKQNENHNPAPATRYQSGFARFFFQVAIFCFSSDM